MGNVASFHGVVEAALLSKVKRRSQILHFLHGSPDYRAQQVLFCAHSTSVLTPQSTVQRHRSIRTIYAEPTRLFLFTDDAQRWKTNHDKSGLMEVACALPSHEIFALHYLLKIIICIEGVIKI
ncbi:hypothetical protein PoB_005258200 [Plakobranchus ocellatus]|uniref:Uncharacterized protein n=1 Tax=Plakobranchus ocellatus TaxID=259542 RepID=A0AAV4C3Z9_9GAST|nr:hypothetical protein PoB_005258200 [Plakobranchus ocellatus]